MKNFLSLTAIIFGCLTKEANANAGISALSKVKTAVSDIDYRYFVAGGTCAAISHGITTPIDVVKTRMQAQPEVRELNIIFCISFLFLYFIYVI